MNGASRNGSALAHAVARPVMLTHESAVIETESETRMTDRELLLEVSRSLQDVAEGVKRIDRIVTGTDSPDEGMVMRLAETRADIKALCLRVDAMEKIGSERAGRVAKYRDHIIITLLSLGVVGIAGLVWNAAGKSG